MNDDGEHLATVHLARRSDGGLRVWSDELPGLVLSGSEPDKVMADVLPAITVMRTDAEIARIRQQLRNGNAEAARVAKERGLTIDPWLRPIGPP